MRHKLVGSVVLNATGSGTVTITARLPLAIYHTRVQVGPAPGQPKTVKKPDALVLVDGTEFENTHSGHNDSSPTAYELDATDTVECRWSGGDPGATATLILRGTAI